MFTDFHVSASTPSGGNDVFTVEVRGSGSGTELRVTSPNFLPTNWVLASAFTRVRLTTTNGNDTLNASNSPLKVRFDSGNGDDSMLGSSFGDEYYGGANNDTVNGGLGNDSIYGEANGDSLSGNDGNDILDGGSGSGADTLIGGGGNDTMVGRQGSDSLFGVDGNDSVNSVDSPALQDAAIAGGGGTDTLTRDSLDSVISGFEYIL